MTDYTGAALGDIPIAILDTETTGLYPEMGHRVVELGVIRLERWCEVGQLTSLIQPGRAMDGGASSVNGITDADLVNQPTFGAVVDELLDLIDGALVVAHNATFDAGFLSMELYINGHARSEQHSLPNPWLCTLELARRNFHFGGNKLGHIAQQLGIVTGRAHRALSDVYTTSEILKYMIDVLEKRHLSTVEDLILAQGGPIYAPRLPKVHLPDPISQAIAARRSLDIVYMGNTGESHRTITPLYPTVYKGHSYLVARCHLRKDQRTFRLDRILSVNIR